MLCGCHCAAGVQVELRAEGQARCCLPPPPPHTHTTQTHAHTHTKRRALLGASCAGRLLGPAAVVHHTHACTTRTRTPSAAQRCGRPPPHARTTRTRSAARCLALRVRAACLGPLPAAAFHHRHAPHARTRCLALHTLLGPAAVIQHHTPAPHTCTRSAARCLALRVRAACWGPLLPSTTHSVIMCSLTHTLLGASHVAGTR